MVCDAVIGMLEETGEKVLERARKRGMSEDIVRAFYRNVTSMDEREKAISCIKGLGYEKVKEGKPDLCSGTPCIDDDVKYTQYWNKEEDSMFIVREVNESRGGIKVHDLMPGVRAIELISMTMKSMDVAYAGPEENLKELGMEYEPWECPKTGKPCSNDLKVYRVSDVRQAFGEKMGREIMKDKSFYDSIMLELTETMVRILGYCATSCPKDRE